MTAFFGSNPFSTPVGQRIEQATDASLASENWALNMEICDIINETEDAARDAVKAIRKRLQQNVGKNYTIVMYTLTVLETCVKNCGRRFHLMATNKEFVQDLVKLIGPKNDPPTAVQEKVLSLIQSWADAFKGNPEMSGVVQVYQDLKQKGVEFPMTDLDALAPIHTPHRSVPEPEVPPPVRPPPPPPSSTTCRHTPVEGSFASVPVILSGPVYLTPDQLAKLRSELDMVQTNMTVFSEMLTELNPGQEHPSDLDLLKELHKTLKIMQTRIVELVDKVASEEVTVELLRMNDELNNLFLRFQRFEKNRVGSQGSQSPQTQADVHSNVSEPLIDLGEPVTPVAAAAQNSSAKGVGDLQTQLAGLSMNSGTLSSTLNTMSSIPAQSAEDEFDMFAQSRKATYETSKQSGSSYSDNIHVDQMGFGLGVAAQLRSNQGSALPEQDDVLDDQLQKERDFSEMEAWLSEENGGRSDSDPKQPITSVEFDRFLAERAAAAENLPPATNSTSPANRGAARRQLEKDEQENSLFAL